MTLEETRNAVREYHYRCRDKNSENHTSDGIEIDPHTLTWAEYWLTNMSDKEKNKTRQMGCNMEKQKSYKRTLHRRKLNLSRL